jgi:UDP-2-acetamido-2,6-beta-L-arabino-hexul-4-ose reductase
MNVVVTGANGFIGKNLVASLASRAGVHVTTFDLADEPQALPAMLAAADIVFHLAGVNRPKTEDEFRTGNAELTREVCRMLVDAGSRATLVLSSSVQAAADNPYGISKRQAEEALAWYAAQGGRAVIYRLQNVFGKWCRPNYNSVVATFCHNISHDLPITISHPERQLELVYIDDVVRTFMLELDAGGERKLTTRGVSPSYAVTLGKLAELIRSFRAIRTNLFVPDLADPLTAKLYGTYLTYLASEDFGYNLERKCDARGCLAEFVKSASFGQIFVSRTRPGVTRGNHYHHTKAEKFLVLQGQAIIRFRQILNQDVIEYRVSGEDCRVMDIPPGYTHSIENVGPDELVTLFWASEMFDPQRPDTNYLAVQA